MRVLNKELWPHKVSIPISEGTDTYARETWLFEQFGRWKSQWTVVYHYSYTDFYFKSEADALLFSLRWT